MRRKLSAARSCKSLSAAPEFLPRAPDFSVNHDRKSDSEGSSQIPSASLENQAVAVDAASGSLLELHLGILGC